MHKLFHTALIKNSLIRLNDIEIGPDMSEIERYPWGLTHFIYPIETGTMHSPKEHSMIIRL